MPNVVRPCLPSKGYDGMPCPTSFDRVCFPKAMMACHTRGRSSVCNVQRRRCHASHNIVRSCVLPKGGDVVPRPTLSDCLCCPRAVMSCHARRCRSYLFSKGDQTSFNRVCCPKAMMACHARRRSTVCAVQRRRCHASPNDADRVCYPRALMSCHARRCRLRALYKDGDVMPRPTLPSMCAVQG